MRAQAAMRRRGSVSSRFSRKPRSGTSARDAPESRGTGDDLCKGSAMVGREQLVRAGADCKGAQRSPGEKRDVVRQHGSQSGHGRIQRARKRECTDGGMAKIQLCDRILRTAGIGVAPEPDQESPVQARAAPRKLAGAFNYEEDYDDDVYEKEADPIPLSERDASSEDDAQSRAGDVV